MSVVTEPDQAQADAVREWLEQEGLGRIQFDKVDVESALNAFDEMTWIYRGFLPESADDPDRQTDDAIPLDDVVVLDRELRDKALSLGLRYPWSIEIVPAGDEPTHPDDQD